MFRIYLLFYFNACLCVSTPVHIMYCWTYSICFGTAAFSSFFGNFLKVLCKTSWFDSRISTLVFFLIISIVFLYLFMLPSFFICLCCISKFFFFLMKIESITKYSVFFLSFYSYPLFLYISK